MIKYEEGFWNIPGTDRIIGRPSDLWVQSHRDRAIILDYILACAMALLTSIFFLLQSFYHYISKSVTKSSFMSSFEFRLNIVCSLIVIAVFPLIQYLFRNNHALREAAPQMAFSVVLLIIGILGVRTHFRFQSLLKVAMLTISESTQGVVEKLEYFKDMVSTRNKPSSDERGGGIFFEFELKRHHILACADALTFFLSFSFL